MKPTTERIITSNVCNYCGIPCEDSTVKKRDMYFCCFGCAAIYDVVLPGDLTEDLPIHLLQYDLPEVFEKAVEFKNDIHYRIRLNTPAIHCSSCIELIEELPGLDERILSSDVNFEEKSVVINAKREIPLSELAYLMERLGYPPHFNLTETDNQKSNSEQRDLLKKLAVTGFCFGNTMLFSIPHYLGLELATDPWFANLFITLNLVLSVVVVAYGARDYLSSAFKAISLRKSHLNIPISLGILAIWAWSAYEMVSGTGFGYLDSLAGLIFFLLAGKWFQSRVYKKVSFERSLHDLLPLTVRMNSENSEPWKRVSDLKAGDQIWVKNGEVIPVSGILMNGEALVDYSFVTGESNPQETKIGDKIYIGGKQLLGDIHITLITEPDPAAVWSAWKTTRKIINDKNWTSHVSRYFTPFVLFISFASAIFWLFYQPEKALFVFSSVLIVACPCALALSSPFTFGSIQRFFSRNGLYMKSTEYVSRIANIQHIVFDKTGTLTEAGKRDTLILKNSLSQDEEAATKLLAQASNHIIGKWLSSTLSGQSSASISGLEISEGKGVSGLVGNMKIRIGSSEFIKANSQVSGTHAIVEINGDVKGIYAFGNRYKEGLSDTLEQLGLMYKLSVLSGDNESEKGNLQGIYSKFEFLGFKHLPEEKKAYLDKLSRKKISTVMIGDGLNDQIALSASDIGLVVTEHINGFYPSSDGVLMSDQLNKLPALMKLGSYATPVLWISLAFSILYNFIGISFAVTGQLNPMIAAILMPISSITVVGLVTALVSRKAKKLQLA
jgi:P-type Cu+ transporter